MKLTINTQDTYIPEFNGNKLLPEDEKIIITYNMPTVRINESLSNLKFNFNQDGEVTGTTDITREKVCSVFIKEIRNLIVEISGNAISIKNAKDLFSNNAPVCLEPLCDELFDFFNRIRKTSINEKN